MGIKIMSLNGIVEEMSTRTQLTVDEKKAIVEMYRDGQQPISYIAQQFERHKGTIRYVIKLYDETDSLKRRSKLSSKEKHRIKKLVNKKRTIGNQIKTKLGLSVSLNTIRTYLHKHGYHYGVSKKVPCWLKKS
jgi:transposase-like protein